MLTPYLTKINLTAQNLTSEIQRIFTKIYPCNTPQTSQVPAVLCQTASCLNHSPADCITWYAPSTETKKIVLAGPAGHSFTSLPSSSNPGHPSVLANNRVHTMTCINRLILQTTYCRILFIKIREKGILFPLQRLFFTISLLPFYALFLLLRYLRFLFCKGNSVEFKPIWLLICFAYKAQPGESHFLVLGLVSHRTNVMRRSFF